MITKCINQFLASDTMLESSFVGSVHAAYSTRYSVPWFDKKEATQEPLGENHNKLPIKHDKIGEYLPCPILSLEKTIPQLPTILLT